MLKDQLGERLAAEAEADFNGPRKTPTGARPELVGERPRFEKRREPGRFDRGRGERPGPKRFVGERGRDDGRDAPRGRVLIDETDPYAPPPGERSRKPAERNVFRDDSAPPKPRHRRLDKEDFGARRRAAMLGDNPDFKVERGETADRSGRRVDVERIRGPREDDRPPRKGFRSRDGGDRRPARFDQDRPPPRRGADRPPQRSRRDDDRPRGAASERPFRKSRFSESDERPPRRLDREDSHQRRPDERNGDRKPFRDKGPPRDGARSGGRAGGFDGKPRGAKPSGTPRSGGRGRRD
jgi:23S rRNA pseudouridine2605 synthase